MTTEENEALPSTSTGEGGGEEEGGLSKKDLKKLAKKAEKAAKKQKGDDGVAAGGAADRNSTNGAPEGNATAAPPATATASTTAETNETVTTNDATTPTLQLLHADTSLHTLKALWASQLYHVTLTPIKASQLSPAATGALHLAANKPALVYGDHVVLGGGNCMAKAISMMPSTTTTTTATTVRPHVSVQESFQVDEWCEWERTTLRHARKDHDDANKALTAALQHLDKALTLHAGIHLVGHADTVADICMVTTLSSIIHTSNPTIKVPPAVLRYVQGHEAALEQAKQAMVELQKIPALDVYDNPSMVNVVIQVFRDVIQDTFDLNDTQVPALGAKNVVIKCQNPKHGDFQCTAAMPMFAALKHRWASPHAAAQAIVDAIGTDHPVLTEVTVTGPGFIACRITSSFLQYHINKFLETGVLPIPANITPQVCLVDFSSPNIAKDMHVGHLRYDKR